jgi:hypothetical protein
VIPLLALVWAALPLHHCNVAAAADRAATAQAGAVLDAAAAALSAGPGAAHCHQHAADDGQPAKPGVRCGDLGRAAPDLRPTAVADVVLAHVTWDAGWLHRGLRPVNLNGAPRPLDDGRWRVRPLHLQKAVLLI